MNPNMSNMNSMQNAFHTEASIESWFSQEEDKLEPLHQEGNWM